MPEGYTTHDGYNFNGDFAAVSNQKNGQGVQKSYISNKSQKPVSKPIDPSTIKINWNNINTGSWQTPVQPTTTFVTGTMPFAKTVDTQVRTTPSTKTATQTAPGSTNAQQQKSTVKPINNNIFLNGFQNRRNEVKDVRAMQDKLIKLGLLNDKFGADGKWGKNTEAAYQKYLATQNAIQNVPTYQKPENPVSPAAMIGIYPEDNKPLYQQIRFKNGGQLVSRNPIKRFKNRGC